MSASVRPLALVGQRAQRLREQLPLARPGSTARPCACSCRVPSSADPVAEVEVLEVVECSSPTSSRETISWIRAGPVRRSAKIEAAVAADQHQPPGDADGLVASRPAPRPVELGEHLGDACGRGRSGPGRARSRARAAPRASASRCSRSRGDEALGAARPPPRPALALHARASVRKIAAVGSSCHAESDRASTRSSRRRRRDRAPARLRGAGPVQPDRARDRQRRRRRDLRHRRHRRRPVRRPGRRHLVRDRRASPPA